MNKGKLERVYIDDFVPMQGKRQNTVVFDFDDDWYCVLLITAEMSKTEVAARLRLLSDVLLTRAEKDGRK